MRRLRTEEALRQKQDNVPLPAADPFDSRSSRVPSEKEPWLTVKEAFDIAAERGFAKSERTFRRLISDALATQVMPPDLKQVGLIANWQVRQKANPNNHSVRWLRFEKLRTTQPTDPAP